MEIPFSSQSDAKVRAKIRAIAMLLERHSLEWAQGAYTLGDKKPDDPYISEVLLHLESLRGRTLQSVEVFAGGKPLDFKYTMGFNESPSRTVEVTDFMRAYTYHEYPIWDRVDQIAMLTMMDCYGLAPFPLGRINKYEYLFNRGYTIDEKGDFRWRGPYDVLTKKETERTSESWLSTSTASHDMVKVYDYISNVVKRAKVIRELHMSHERKNLPVPERVPAFQACPTLVELCLAKINDITVDQNPVTFKERAAKYPHWVQPQYEWGRAQLKVRDGKYVNDGYYPLLRPDFFHHLGAFKTGGSPKGIMDNLTKANRSTLVTSADPKHILAGIMTIFRTFRLFGSVDPFISYREFMEVLIQMSLPWDRNAGIHFTKREDLGTFRHVVDDADPDKVFYIKEERRFAMDADRKDNAFPAVVQMIEDLLYRLDKHASMSAFYDREWFPLLTSKLGNKVEILFPEADRSKNRIFFISCLMKVVIQKMLLASALNNTYGRNFVGISHCWSKGGVFRVADQLSFSDVQNKVRTWMMGDFSALDQSLKAGILCLLGIMWIFSTRPGVAPPNVQKAWDFMTAWMADDTAITLVKWFSNEWRLVFGVLFSGEYITSIFDTFYVFIALMVVHYVFADRLKAIDSSRSLEIRKRLMYELEKYALIYGDDLCWTLPTDLIKDIEEVCCHDGRSYLDEVVYILKDQFDMVLKPPGSSDTNKYDTPYSKVTHDGVVIPINGDYGFKWLRRYFFETKITIQKKDKVKEIDSIASVRRISDYWSKATNTHHDALTYSNKKWLERIRAFCVENMGTSKAIDFFCRSFYHSLEVYPVKCMESIEVPGEFPIHGRVQEALNRPVVDSTSDHITERRKYMMVDPDLSEEYMRMPGLPSRSKLINDFGRFKDQSKFRTTLRRCTKMSHGPLVPPRDD